MEDILKECLLKNNLDLTLETIPRNIALDLIKNYDTYCRAAENRRNMK